MDEFDFDYEAPARTEAAKSTAIAEPAQPAAPVQTTSTPQQIITMPIIPDIDLMVEGDIAFGSEYWTPQDIGESKRGTVLRFEIQPYDKVDDRTGEITQLDLKVVIFAQYRGSTVKQVYANGGKRLVASIENAVNSGLIIPEKTPVVIRYLGKRKNSTNGFMSDDFEVKPLVLPVA